MNTNAPVWFFNEINAGLSSLRVLKQRNPPTGEFLPGTETTVAELNVTEWIAVLWPSKAWSEKSISRIRQTFRELPIRSPEWPTVHDFLQVFDELNIRAQNSGLLPAPDLSKEERARLAEVGRRRAQEALAEIAKHAKAQDAAQYRENLARIFQGPSSKAEAEFLEQQQATAEKATREPGEEG